MQKITPFLWYDTQAEEAAEFYTSIFKDGKITDRRYYGKGSPLPEGSLMTVSFELLGQEFIAMNGGPVFRFNPSVSFFVQCDTQEEVDEYGTKLCEGGEEQPCGWLKDRYGLSWQIIPRLLGELMSDPDPLKAGRVMQAMLTMKKIDMKALQKAYEQ